MCIFIFHVIHRGVIVSVLISIAVDRVFETRSGQTKDNTVGICCFSAKHEVLRIKNKHWLALNQDNVSDWSDISVRGRFVQCTSTIQNPTKLVGLAKSGPHHHLI